jgi:hypothetical protein
MYSEIPAVTFLPCIRTEILFGSIFPAHNENSKYGLWITFGSTDATGVVESCRLVSHSQKSRTGHHG